MKQATERIFLLFRQGVIYSAGGFLHKLVLFLAIPIYAYHIAPEDLSLLEILDPAEQFAYGLLNMGLLHAFYRYYTKAGDPDYTSRVVSTVFWFIVSVTLAAGGLFLWSAGPVAGFLLPDHPLALSCFSLAIASLMLRLLHLLPSAFLHMQQKAAQHSGWLIAGAAGFVTYVFIALVFADGTIRSVFEGRLLMLLPLIVAGTWQFSGYIRAHINLRLLGQMLLFSSPFILSASAYPILSYADRWILSTLISAEATGIYGMSYRFGMIPGMLLVTPFLKAWRPFIYSYDDDETTQHQVYRRVMLYYTLPGCLLWLGLSVFSQHIIMLFTSQAYYDGHIIIPYVAASQFFYGLGWILIAGLAVREKTLFIGLFTLMAALLNIALNFLLIPAMGITGAALATLFSFFTIFLCYGFYARRHLPISWPAGRFLAMLAVTVATWLLAGLSPFETLRWDVVFRAIVCLLPLYGLLRLAGLDTERIRSIMEGLKQR